MLTLALVRLPVIPETGKLTTRGAAVHVCAPPAPPSGIGPTPVPANVAALPQGVAEGPTLADGDAEAEGDGVAEAVADGLAVGVTDDAGVGVGVAHGAASGLQMCRA